MILIERLPFELQAVSGRSIHHHSVKRGSKGSKNKSKLAPGNVDAAGASVLVRCTCQH